MCGSGSTQSPIDISTTQPAGSGCTVSMWQPGAILDVVNNGHTIQANIKAGSAIQIDGVKYELLQFHFHSPSEHTVNGKSFALETHFVHKSEKGDLAVVGVLRGLGDANPALAPLWATLPKKVDEKTGLASFDLLSVLPRGQQIFRYAGSLTTPPLHRGRALAGDTVAHDRVAGTGKRVPRDLQDHQPPRAADQGSRRHAGSRLAVACGPRPPGQFVPTRSGVEMKPDLGVVTTLTPVPAPRRRGEGCLDSRLASRVERSRR